MFQLLFLFYLLGNLHALFNLIVKFTGFGGRQTFDLCKGVFSRVFSLFTFCGQDLWWYPLILPTSLRANHCRPACDRCLLIANVQIAIQRKFILIKVKPKKQSSNVCYEVVSAVIQLLKKTPDHISSSSFITNSF